MDADEQHVLELARELQAHVERITKDLDPNDPVVANLRAKPAAVIRHIEQAIECGEADKVCRAYVEKHGGTQKDRIYSWEHLPVYAWVNEFARVIGRLLASMHKRYYVHVHNIAGEAMLLSKCIAMGHREPAPGEVISVEELRAYRLIGYHSARHTLNLLEDLSKATGYAASGVAHGKKLVRQIRDQFQADLDELEPNTRTPGRGGEIQALPM